MEVVEKSKKVEKPPSEEKINELLENLYFSISSFSAAFSSGRNLYKEAQRILPTISKSDVRRWLKKEPSYTLHRPVRRKFKTRPVMVYEIDEQWQADLVDLQKISKYNKGFKHLLVVIDVLSKYAWLVPLKTKTGRELREALEHLFNTSKRCPKFLQTEGD